MELKNQLGFVLGVLFLSHALLDYLLVGHGLSLVWWVSLALALDHIAG